MTRNAISEGDVVFFTLENAVEVLAPYLRDQVNISETSAPSNLNKISGR